MDEKTGLRNGNKNKYEHVKNGYTDLTFQFYVEKNNYSNLIIQFQVTFCSADLHILLITFKKNN